MSGYSEVGSSIWLPHWTLAWGEWEIRIMGPLLPPVLQGKPANRFFLQWLLLTGMAQGTSWKKAGPWPHLGPHAVPCLSQQWFPSHHRGDSQMLLGKDSNYPVLLSITNPSPSLSDIILSGWCPSFHLCCPTTHTFQWAYQPATPTWQILTLGCMKGSGVGGKQQTFPPPGWRARHWGDCADHKTLNGHKICTNVCDFANTLAWTFQQQHKECQVLKMQYWSYWCSIS